MRRSRLSGLAIALALPAVTGLLGCGAHAPPPQVGAAAGIRFGVTMAQRGLWNEALFRFEQARARNPDNPRVLNDVAVAYEAVGRYEDALAAYKEALKLDPANRQVKQNYARFVEFYQGFKGRPAAPAPAPAPTPVPAPALTAPPPPTEPPPIEPLTAEPPPPPPPPSRSTGGG